LPACPVRSASRSLKVLATALKEHGAYAPDVGAATRCLRTGCWRCDTVLTHRMLALRHGAYAPGVGAATRHPQMGCCR
jgi:hypothetical protein